MFTRDLVCGDVLLAVPDVRAAHAVFLGVVITLGAELLQLGFQTLLLGLGVLHGDQLPHLAQRMVNIVKLRVQRETQRQNYTLR